MAGINPRAFIRVEEPAEMLAMQEIWTAAQKERKQEYQNLAIEIANRVGEMLSG